MGVHIAQVTCLFNNVQGDMKYNNKYDEIYNVKQQNGIQIKQKVI